MTYCPKTYFSDEEQALIYVKKLNSTSLRDKKPKRAYLCKDCLNWHITSQDENLSQIDLMRNEIIKLKKEIQLLNPQIKKYNEKYIHKKRIN